ncbi:MAG: Flp pilus assembly protein CpaB [Gammaproteobacteria bacterium]|nr:Flp pilus assembly protein CpaB [Gammaproteobacteria bacterium]
MRARLGPLGRFSTGHWVMLVAGLVAVVLNFAYLRSQQNTIDVAVAAEDIPAGARLVTEMVRFTPVHAQNDVEDRMVGTGELDGLIGMVVARSIPSGTLLSRRDFVMLSSTVRAMSIPVDPEHAVGGALRPGDRVDVLQSADGIARYVLVGAEVLMVSDGSGGALGGAGRYAVTVALDAESALEVAAALSEGTLDLVRSTGAAPPSVLVYPPDDEP